MFMSKMETFIVLIWSSRHRMPHSLRDSHCFIFVNPKFKSKSLSQQTPTKSKASTIISQAMPWLSNANTMTANWPILILIIDGTNNIRCFHNLTTCNFKRQGYHAGLFLAAKHSSTSPNVCVCVCGQLVFPALYNLQNVPECSRMHAECSSMFQNNCRMLQNAYRMFKNVPEWMQNVPECMHFYELACKYINLHPVA